MEKFSTLDCSAQLPGPTWQGLVFRQLVIYELSRPGDIVTCTRSINHEKSKSFINHIATAACTIGEPIAHSPSEMGSRMKTPIAILTFALIICSSSFTQAQVGMQDTCEDMKAEKAAQESTLQPSVSLESSSSNSQAPKVALNAKLVNIWNDVLFCVGENSFSNLALDVDLTISDGGTYGGTTALIGGNYARFATSFVKPPNGKRIEVIDYEKLVHMVHFAGGFQTNATFQNISLLLEGGYIPLLVSPNVDLWLGLPSEDRTWAQVGTYVQAGYTTTYSPAESVNTTQEGSEQANLQGPFLRVKVGGTSDIRVPVNLSGVKAFRFLPEAWVWYDVIDNQFYGLLESTLDLEITDKVSYNLIKVKYGYAPPDFAPGTQLSTGLTIRF